MGTFRRCLFPVAKGKPSRCPSFYFSPACISSPPPPPLPPTYKINRLSLLLLLLLKLYILQSLTRFPFQLPLASDPAPGQWSSSPSSFLFSCWQFSEIQSGCKKAIIPCRYSESESHTFVLRSNERFSWSLVPVENHARIQIYSVPAPKVALHWFNV